MKNIFKGIVAGILTGVILTSLGAYPGPGTGTGLPVYQTSPTLVTPTLGNATASQMTYSGSSSGNTIVKASATASGTLTFPAATDTLIGKATTDILTNKTFDTGATGNVFKFFGVTVSGVTGTGNAVLSTSPTLTGTTSITNSIFTNAPQMNSGVQYNGATSGSTLIQPTATASGTLTLPAATDTLIGKATTDVLTNKTFDTAGAGNVFKINGTQISTNTGTGANVLSTSPSITTPAISGGTIDNTAIGGITAASGAFTTLNTNGNVTLNENTSALPAPSTGTILQVGQADGSVSKITIDSFGAVGNISLRRADGTNASKTQLIQNDTIGSVTAMGYSSAGYSTTGRATINFVAEEAWTGTNQGAAINFTTTLNGTTSQTIRQIIDNAGNVINAAGIADQSYSYQTPVNAFSITIGAGVETLILDPAGTLASGTITMPAAPINGQIIRISSSQNITALTVSPNSGQSIKNAPTTLTVNLTGDQGYEFIYRSTNTTWYRLQ